MESITKKQGFGSGYEEQPSCKHCGHVGRPVYWKSVGRQKTLTGEFIDQDKRLDHPICELCKKEWSE